MSCKNCFIILKKQNINSDSAFRKWSLKGHPDKGGDEAIFKEVSSCNDDFFKVRKCNWNN